MKRLICLTLCMAAPSLVHAAAPITDTFERSFDFALSFGKTETEFTYADSAVVDSTIEFFEVNWYERVYTDIDIGFHAGKTYFSQTGRAITAGAELDGTHAGIGLRAIFFQTWPIRPFLHATYTYRRIKRDDTEPVTLSWHEPRLQIGVTTAPWNLLRIYGGADWSSVDGSERSRGVVPGTTDFRRKGDIDGFFGLDLTVETTGSIGVEIHSGDVNRSIEIYFKRQY